MSGEEIKNEELDQELEQEGAPEEEAVEAVQEGSEEAEGCGSEDSGKDQTPEKKSFFKKKKDPRDEKIEDLTDRLKRSMAEFDNFRKRTEKEKSAMYEIGARDIIEKILPVVDNFERGLAAVPEDAK
ncbi:MAG: nucleotide exchange factor GrpE, partial [Lachnospiraceae bacterium]|nr:nucleotide exchange factor GrpE [Lachnospiraceae bacterium]